MYNNKNYPKEPTVFDVERMAKAKEKRIRKQNKRLQNEV